MKRLLILISLIMLIIVSILFYIYQKYNLLAISLSIFLLALFFIYYEKKSAKSREIVCVAVMIALAVAGRCLFALTPGFKPVTAIIVVTGIYFGVPSGFITGALTALLSNILFGQGPWTVFQMISWGITGALAGLCSKFIKTIPGLIIMAIFAGISYSLLMDIWTVLSYNDGFTLNLYITAISASLPFMGLYILSNIVFLLVLNKPIGKQLERMKIKYGVFTNN